MAYIIGGALEGDPLGEQSRTGAIKACERLEVWLFCYWIISKDDREALVDVIVVDIVAAAVPAVGSYVIEGGC